MVVWQFTTIAALIGALLIYVMVLTNRLGATNSLLKRIEEALVRAQTGTENVPARGTDSRASESVRAEPAPARAPAAAAVAASASAEALEEAVASEIPDRDRRVSYLTVRELKVIARSGRRSSDTPMGVSPLFTEAFERKRDHSEAPTPAPAIQDEPPADAVVSEDPLVASFESHEVLEANRAAAVVGQLAVATTELREFLEATPTADPVLATEEPAVALREAVSISAVDLAAPHVDPVVAHTEPTLDSAAVTLPVVDVPPAAPDIAAANEDSPAAAEAPAAAASIESQARDAELEERRKRDILMHARRRRRMR